MKEYWQQLAPREKQLLIFMSIVVLITLFYFAFWKPMKAGIEEGELHLKAQTRALIKIRQQAAEVRQLRSGGAGKQIMIEDSSSLLGLIERSAKQKKINGNLQKVQPEGQREVRVWMENVSFDQLISWLDLLSNRYAIEISEISLERGNSPGIVNGRVLLLAP